VRIGVRYMAQLRTAAGTAAEDVELAELATVADLLARLAALHGGALRPLLLDPEGRAHPTVLVFVGDVQAESRDAPLRQGDVVTLLSPIAGG
jgi:molybdopterin converting factor small subunit